MNVLTTIKSSAIVVKNTAVKYSPEIFLGVGIAAGVAAVVTGIKRSQKGAAVINEYNTNHADINFMEENMSKSDRFKANFKNLTKTGFKLLKVYAVPLGLLTVSVCAQVGMYTVLSKRLAVAATALATVTEAFAAYKERVAEKYGSEAAFEIEHGGYEGKTTVTEIDPETGEVTKKKVNFFGVEGAGLYSFYLDKVTCPEAVDDTLAMDSWLGGTYSCIKRTLEYNKTETLREALEQFNLRDGVIPEAFNNAALVVGWKKDDNDPEGDSKVFFKHTRTYRKLEDGSVIPTIIIDLVPEVVLFDAVGI